MHNWSYPITIINNAGIGSCEIDTETSCSCAKEKNSDIAFQIIEFLNLKSLRSKVEEHIKWLWTYINTNYKPHNLHSTTHWVWILTRKYQESHVTCFFLSSNFTCPSILQTPIPFSSNQYSIRSKTLVHWEKMRTWRENILAIINYIIKNAPSSSHYKIIYFMLSCKKTL